MTLSCLHHIAVIVSDLSRAARFYGGVLGLDEIRRWDDHNGNERSIWYTLGAAEVGSPFLAVELGRGGTGRHDEDPGWHCVALAIDLSERERWGEALEVHGYSVERTSRFTLYVRDPDGNLVGLSHYPNPAQEA